MANDRVRYVDRETELCTQDENNRDLSRKESYIIRDHSLASVGKFKVVRVPPLELKEPKGPDIATRKRNSNKSCTFYRSDDRKFISITLNVSGYKSIDRLIEDINIKMYGFSYDVFHIYPIPQGQLIRSLDELEHNGSYVVCREKLPSARKSIGRGKQTAQQPQTTQQPPITQQSRQFKGRIINIYQNRKRERKEMVILNPQTGKGFEEILDDIGNRLNINGTCLLTLTDPERRVNHYAELFSEFKHIEDFILCDKQTDTNDTEDRKKKKPIRQNKK